MTPVSAGEEQSAWLNRGAECACSRGEIGLCGGGSPIGVEFAGPVAGHAVDVRVGPHLRGYHLQRWRANGYLMVNAVWNGDSWVIGGIVRTFRVVFVVFLAFVACSAALAGSLDRGTLTELAAEAGLHVVSCPPSSQPGVAYQICGKVSDLAQFGALFGTILQTSGFTVYQDWQGTGGFIEGSFTDFNIMVDVTMEPAYKVVVVSVAYI